MSCSAARRQPGCASWSAPLIWRRPDAAELRAEVAELLFHAVIGTSRLPLSSVEAPHTLFTFGRLAYFPHITSADAEPMRTPQELIERGLTATLPRREYVKLLETLLRATPVDELAEMTRQLMVRCLALGRACQDWCSVPHALRLLFLEVSLSPWTGFVENALAFVRQLEAEGWHSLAERLDLLTELLTLLADHLTAYDLITFHYRGANYPDALFLDLLLKECLDLAERRPELFRAEAAPANRQDAPCKRRQALLRGWLLRRCYEGHPVPDAPTSPGENTRVLPPPHVHVPEEQILQTTRRRRRLFENDSLPIGSESLGVLHQGVANLFDPRLLADLGRAVFIDRPLGVFKAPAEPDLTRLLAYRAVSPSIAARRLEQLLRDPILAAPPALAEQLCAKIAAGLTVRGLPIRDVPEESRPVVALADARKVAADFVVVSTLPAGRHWLRDQLVAADLHIRFDLNYLAYDTQVLIVRVAPHGTEWEPVLAVYDGEYRKRLELGVRPADGYERRGVREMPASGLRLLRVWQEEAGGLREIDLTGEMVMLRPPPQAG